MTKLLMLWDLQRAIGSIFDQYLGSFIINNMYTRSYLFKL